MDEEILKDFYEAVDKEINYAGPNLWKAFLKHKDILDIYVENILSEHEDEIYKLNFGD